MNYRRKSLEEIPEESTAIWSCTKEGCIGWMRDNFSFESAPICRLCSSPMIRTQKLLPAIINSNGDLKAIKKGIPI